MERYIGVTNAAGERFYRAFHDKGPLVMLNLLKFKEVADYTDLADIKPKEEVSGAKAYRIYMKHTQPLIEKAGSQVLFYGSSKHFLIGPEQEQWDAVLLVTHPSVDGFMAFAKDPEYLKTLGHRTAALEDSRLLPISEFKKEG